MLIRVATGEDVCAAGAIYDSARKFMRECGNYNQWSDAYPTGEHVAMGIEDGTSYVCEDEGEIVGTFFFRVGVDPTYNVIYGGEWLNNDPYAVVHRIAVKYHGRGIGEFILRKCFEIHPNLKIDTHRDNAPMQHTLKKLGFCYCGIIHLENGEERLAYHKC